MSANDNIILDLTTEEIVNTYNVMSKIQVKKFKDRKTAENRLHGLAMMDSNKFIKAMRAAKVRPAMIKKYEAELADAAKTATQQADKNAATQKQIASEEKPTKPAKAEKPAKPAKAEKPAKPAKAEKPAKPAKAEKPSATPEPSPAPAKPAATEVKVVAPKLNPSNDPDFAAAAQLLLNHQAELKSIEIQEAGGSLPQRRRSATSDLTIKSKAGSVLWFTQNVLKQHKEKQEELVATTVEIAQSAMITQKEANKWLDALKEMGYINIEDDTVPGSDDCFYYVTLTDKGKAFELKDSMPDAPERKPKEPRAPRQPKEPGAPRAPRGEYAGKKIFKLVKENPRREGSIGYKSFQLYRDGMTVEEYVEAGGRVGDVRWDVDHKFIELR